MVNISGAYGKLKTWVKAQLHTDHQSAASESASFKDVNIAVNEAYKQGAAIILRIKDLNTYIGEDSGKVTTGNYNNFVGYRSGYANAAGYGNNFMGYRSGYSNTSGYRNNFLGYQAGYSNTTGDLNNFIGAFSGYSNVGGVRNNFMGYRSGYSNGEGHRNNFIGFYSGYSNTSGAYNNFMGGYSGYSNVGGTRNNFLGGYSGYSNTSGERNNFMGYHTGYSNVSGSNNNFLGSYAGYYATGSSKLFIDNQIRTNEADEKIKALIYGIFDSLTANQLLRINGIFELTEINSGSTQANAGAAANEVWKTNGHASLPDNVLMIGV